jgi:hypothetical protein
MNPAAPVTRMGSRKIMPFAAAADIRPIKLEFGHCAG